MPDCQWCGEQFPAMNLYAKFCSARCRVAANRAGKRRAPGPDGFPPKEERKAGRGTRSVTPPVTVRTHAKIENLPSVNHAPPPVTTRLQGSPSNGRQIVVHQMPVDRRTPSTLPVPMTMYMDMFYQAAPDGTAAEIILWRRRMAETAERAEAGGFEAGVMTERQRAAPMIADTDEEMPAWQLAVFEEPRWLLAVIIPIGLLIAWLNWPGAPPAPPMAAPKPFWA
jgi:hypothetical protein